MGSLDTKTPVRADHRFIHQLISVTLDGKVEEIPAEFDRVSRVFQKAGGSWMRLFRGSPKDVSLLKKILKVAHKKGYLTKKSKWNGTNG